jgi:uncharacterized membrane protein YoaK (UPF0700 family)
VIIPARRPVPALVPPVLSFIAGFVDSCTALALFGLFVAQVTGSFVLAAVAFVTNEPGVVIKVLAIPVFLMAAAVTTVLAVVAERRGRSPIAWCLGLESAALTAFSGLAFAGIPAAGPNTPIVIAASLLGLFAMGTQSASVRLLMRGVASTNVMTTNTTQVAIDATEVVLTWRACRRSPAAAEARAAYQAARARLVALAPIMAGFLLGTIAGALAYVTTGLWGLLLPLALMYAIMAWAIRSKP